LKTIYLISLLLLEDAVVGDYVIVHAGFVIQKIDEAAALETLQLSGFQKKENLELVPKRAPLTIAVWPD
jgi:hydrogenase maturation factor